MALKDIDFKQVLIEKGERIGLVVAVAVTAVLVIVSGVFSALNGSSPSKNTEIIQNAKKTAENAWRTSPVPADLDKLPDDLQTAEVKPVRGDLFPCANYMFVTLEGEDLKWRLPKVMAPDEFQIDLIRGAIQTYWIYIDPKDSKSIKVAVLTAKASTELTEQQKKMKADLENKFMTEKQKKRLKAIMRAQEALSRQQAAGGAGAAVPGAVAAPGTPGGRGKGAGAPGGLITSLQPGYPGQEKPGSKEAAQEQEVKWITPEKLKDENGKLAETNVPVRMVMVTAAFPYKEQVEEFRRALRFNTVDQLLYDEGGLRPEFTGFNVQRRIYGPDGKLVEEWADLDLETPLKDIRIRTKELEPEDPQFVEFGVIPQPNRLVIPRPKLARDQKYPDLKLESIQDTLKKMEDALKDNAPPPPKVKSQFEDIDIFETQAPTAAQGAGGDSSAVGPAGKAGGKLGGERLPPQGPPGSRDASLSNQRAVAVPEKILVRFMDVTVFPGYSYEYRVQIRMGNPTHKHPERAVSKDLTKEDQIVGPWQQVTWKEGDQVTTKFPIPDELLYYAGEEKSATKDRVAVQIHHWLGFVQAKWNQRGSEIPVGDWSVLEKRLVSRGEYLGEIKEVELATWNTTQERYALAVHPDEQIASKQRTGPKYRIHKHKGIAVDFATDPVFSARPLLVDFKGGEHAVPSSEPGKLSTKLYGPVEMLLLDADGKLLVRNSRVDTENKDRQDRFTTWKNWIEQIKNQPEDTKGGKDDPFAKPTSGRRPGGGER
jgi:hypothetical protein